MLITDKDQIDLDRVVVDPEYRRHVVAFLNEHAGDGGSARHASRAGQMAHGHRHLVDYPRDAS